MKKIPLFKNDNDGDDDDDDNEDVDDDDDITTNISGYYTCFKKLSLLSV